MKQMIISSWLALWLLGAWPAVAEQLYRYEESAEVSYEGYKINDKFYSCEKEEIPTRSQPTPIDGTCRGSSGPQDASVLIKVLSRDSQGVNIEILVGPPDLVGKKLRVPRDKFESIPGSNDTYLNLDRTQTLTLREDVRELDFKALPGADDRVRF